MSNRKLLNIELGRVDAEEYRKLPETGVVVVLDNIRSAHNVGSAFRSCDSFKTDRICLCGICAVPPSAEIHKSALGAEYSVPWEHYDDTLSAVAGLRAEGYTIISIEQTVGSVSLDSFNPYQQACSASEKSGGHAPDGLTAGGGAPKIAVIFGNEVAGVRQDVVDASDFSIEIPQYGTKHSLNVSVTIGIVLWHIRLMKNVILIQKEGVQGLRA